MKPSQNSSCPEATLASLTVSIGADAQQGMRDLGRLLQEFPADARLHFMRGSLLAGEQDYIGASESMRKAVHLAPEFYIAKFQLGFILLTSGKKHEALEAWGPLHSLPDDTYLLLFVKGLSALAKDDFSGAVKMLEQGIENNKENAALNRDMALIIEEIDGRRDLTRPAREISSVGFLLQQAALKTRH